MWNDMLIFTHQPISVNEIIEDFSSLDRIIDYNIIKRKRSHMYLDNLREILRGMKNYKVLMTKPARDDLKDIATYIAKKEF